MMISPVSYKPFNNVISFKANNPVIRDAIGVSRMLDKNGYVKTEQGYYNFIHSEIEELKEAKLKNDYANMHEEIGDILFDTIMLADYYKVDPAKALADTNTKIKSRIKIAQTVAKKPLIEYPLEQRLMFWEIAKAELKEKQA